MTYKTQILLIHNRKGGTVFPLFQISWVVIVRATRIVAHGPREEETNSDQIRIYKMIV